ncbi:MAG TPA: oxygenase MpaB family protein [Streptosporangiaceae bacterium]
MRHRQSGTLMPRPAAAAGDAEGTAPSRRTRPGPADEIHASRGDHEGTALAPGDYGLFGPRSATWQLMGEPILWVAGIRALYLQALDPKTMLGTWQNSALVDRHEGWARFLRTTEFVRIRTYGTTAEAERAGRRVRKIHASLTGTDTDGTVFRLDDPEQLLWVHCAEVDSYVNICGRCGIGATPDQLDEFVNEQRHSAALVGLDPANVPASVAELDAYYANARDRAGAVAEARKSLFMTFNPPVPPALLPLKLVAPPVNILAFAALPRWARKLYGAPGSPVTDSVTTVALKGLYQATRVVPARLRYTPTVRHARQIIREHERHQDAAP